MSLQTYVSRRPEDTRRIGRNIGGMATQGTVISLEGPLGSGKTVLAQGIAEGLGVKERLTSPTFTLIAEYLGSTRLYHIDLYRIENAAQLDDIGFDDAVNGQNVAIIEWGKKAKGLLPAEHMAVELSIAADNSRLITISGRLP